MIRTTSSGFSSAFLFSIGRNNSRVSQLMEQISQQKRIIRPSDDPLASAQVSRLRSRQNTLGQYQDNIKSLQGNLNTQETTTGSVEQELLSILDKLREAANSYHGQKDMNSYAADISSSIKTVVDFVNSKDDSGRYQFSGTLTDKKPLEKDGSGNWVFKGNHEKTQAMISDNVMMDVNIDLTSVFGNDLSALNNLQKLVTKMEDPNGVPEDYLKDFTSVIGDIEKAHSATGTMFNELGSRQNNIKLVQDSHSDHDMINQNMIGDLEGLDLPGSMMELEQYKMAMMASYQSYNKIANLSLFSQG